MRRFRVAESSMLPTLLPGDEFVATDSIQPQAGEVVTLPHPERGDFWLVKRMAAGPGEAIGERRLGPDEAWVLSDNASVTTADSRTLGPVAIRDLWRRVTHLDAITFVEAARMLGDEDPGLHSIIEDWGLPVFWQRAQGFPTLVLLILEQQVSLESGAAMYRRLIELLGAVTPGSVLRVGETGLTAIGVTRQKAGYLVSLARGGRGRHPRPRRPPGPGRGRGAGPVAGDEGDRVLDRRRLPALRLAPP